MNNLNLTDLCNANLQISTHFLYITNFLDIRAGILERLLTLVSD